MNPENLTAAELRIAGCTSTSAPEEESTADFIWGGLGVGLQPNPRKAKVAPENMGAQHG